MHPEDPLMQRAEFAHRAEYYLLGFPIQIVTNSPLVLRAAEESWGVWTRTFDRRPIEMRIIVHLEGSVPSTEPVYRSQRDLFTIIADNANFGICDLQRGYCFSCVTPAVARDVYFREHILDGMGYFSIDHLYITIVHAACVALHGRGVLLCGDSGAGKSCLTYACMKRGWTIVSDDFSAVVRGQEDGMVIGKPARIRLRPEALALFPELAGRSSMVTRNGKQVFDLRTGDVPSVRTAPCSHAEKIVFLDRRDSGGPELVPMNAEEALARIEFDRPHWDSPVFDEQRASIRALLSRGAHVMRYRNFNDAIGLLESLIQ